MSKEEKNDMIPLCVPQICGNEWEYIKECLDTNWVSSVGAFVNRFEDMVAEYVGVKYAVAMVNGTAAIHIALLIAEVLPGDEVIVPALTFVSPINCVNYVGAHPVFIDVDLDTLQLDLDKLREFLDKQCKLKDGILTNCITGRKITAILPVDLLGHPVDLDALKEIAEEFGLKIIEDATETLGADYKGRKVGSGSDIACFSFNGNKIITTGGGGMLVTDNKEFADKARYLSQQAKDDAIEYIHKEIGYNYRLTNIQAAMGCAQMEQLDKYVQKKCYIAEFYTKQLSNIKGLRCPKEAEWASSTFWLYTVFINDEITGIDSRSVLQHLQKQQIQTRPLWHPVYSLKPFSEEYSTDIENADILYKQGLSLPCSVDITDDQMQRVIDELKTLL